MIHTPITLPICLPESAGIPAAALPRPLTARGEWTPHAPFAAHAEVFAPAGEASGAGLALGLARAALAAAPRTGEDEAEDRRAWLWVQDAAAIRLGGRPYRPGLPADLRARLVHVAAAKPEDALFALEEGVRCRDLAFVEGEIAGNPRALDFTASRRLVLAAERHGIALWLIRLGASRDLGAARLRWEARAAPSQPGRWNPHAPGAPAWHADLFRARGVRPGAWTVREDGARLSVDKPAAEDAARPQPLTAHGPA